MSAKNMRFTLLLDFYGEMLSDGQRDMMDLYYNEDLSLSEIAEQVGITRQGVRDAVHRAEEALTQYEEKLGLVRRFEALGRQRSAILAAAESLLPLCDAEISRDASEKVRQIIRLAADMEL